MLLDINYFLIEYPNFLAEIDHSLLHVLLLNHVVHHFMGSYHHWTISVKNTVEFGLNLYLMQVLSFSSQNVEKVTDFTSLCEQVADAFGLFPRVSFDELLSLVQNWSREDYRVSQVAAKSSFETIFTLTC